MADQGWMLAMVTLAPIAIIALALIAKGYHVHLRIWRGPKWTPPPDQPEE